MPLIEPSAMIQGRPLPGWVGSFFHATNMTFAIWDIAEGAADLHEHHHEQEEVWMVAEGEIALVVAGDEQLLRPGAAFVIPPNTPHSARIRGRCRAIVVDFPRRDALPGVR